MSIMFVVASIIPRWSVFLAPGWPSGLFFFFEKFVFHTLRLVPCVGHDKWSAQGTGALLCMESI